MKLATKVLGGIWFGLALYYWYAQDAMTLGQLLSMCALFGMTMVTGMIACLDA